MKPTLNLNLISKTPLPRTLALATTLLAGLALSPVAQACAVCGCSLATDAVTEPAAHDAPQGAWRLSLQADHVEQRQLRQGDHRISAHDVAAINGAGGEQEVERRTTNRYLTLGLAWAPAPDWELKALLPYIVRAHTTWAEGTNPLGDDQLSSSATHAFGDLKLLASRSGLFGEPRLTLQAGLKLPTAHYGGVSADGTAVIGRRPTAFRSGPLAANESPDNLLDTSLQAGTGSTDLLLGATWRQALAPQVEGFANLQHQAAIAQRLNDSGADFRPGNSSTLSVGARWTARPGLTPQLQVNLNHKTADGGALADTGNSAGTTLYLSPGLSLDLGHGLQAYGFAQLPLLNHLQGIQLAPTWTASAGVSLAF